MLPYRVDGYSEDVRNAYADRYWPASKELAGPVPMFDPGRFCEEWAGQGTPLLEAIGVAESNHVVIDAFPIHAQAIAGGILHHAFQPHAMASLGRAKEGRGLPHGGNKGFGLCRVDFDIGDFGNHEPGMAALRRIGKP